MSTLFANKIDTTLMAIWMSTELAPLVRVQSCGTMVAMVRDEIPELRKLRNEYDAARAALLAGIRAYLAKGHGPAQIARSVDWSREYIAKIRDGKTKE